MENILFNAGNQTLDDFTANLEIENLIKSMIIRHMNIFFHYKKEYLSILKEMVWHSLNANISILKDFHLYNLDATQKYHEVEFLLYIKDHKILRTPEFQAEVTNGYIRGFLDLVFIYQDKYYILDWKTTNLGASSASYEPNVILPSMLSHGYDMQARLYLYALENYLSNVQKIENAYQKIGGAIYLFSRGVQKNTEQGIYFFKPSKKDLISIL